MEDGSKELVPSEPTVENVNNGVVLPIMANFPEGRDVDFKEDKEISAYCTKLNGESNPDISEENSTSESDALVIDESAPKTKKASKKFNTAKAVSSSKDSIVTHSNPYFNESIFDLSQQHRKDDEKISEVRLDSKVLKLKKGKGKVKPKLKEYAQYLGLQPTVQFKCSKCGRAGFETLPSLNDHIISCTAEKNFPEQIENACSGFKLTRKVFLCSACGTYYENWNLYFHMLEFHRRYICLYCLGMFSSLQDLCHHIQSRHNLEPGHRNNPEEFFKIYNEPCYLICCECNTQFTEQENFFYHNCISNIQPESISNKFNKNKVKNTKIKPENHITGDSSKIPEAENNSEDSNSTNHAEITESLNKTDVVEENSDTNFGTQFTEETRSEIEVEDQSEIKNEVIEEENQENNLSFSDNAKDFSFELKLSPVEKDSMAEADIEEPLETRRVPKLSLKLPKVCEFVEDSDDSDKINQDLEEQVESEAENVEESITQEEEIEETPVPNEPQLQVAGGDISIVELKLEQPLDKFDIKVLLQKCLIATTSVCIYCNHARRIAVNGKQLALHAIAEHRYSAIVNSITAEELIPESFVTRIKESFEELEGTFFSLESSTSEEAVTFSHMFECFQCRYSTSIHKELYLHNRKLHAKNLLLCIMCKSNFYSYSELICHLCPGVYILDYDLQFRCCICISDDLPSAFRLMVHLRKRHHVCDVCLELCHNQYKLSNHVWKHKLHHFCYRCGIAYRNKPDITRHLFWKHGTESVLCKRCLQKKWPHVYHFCVPPSSFACDECNLTFSKAVSLKVHKRLHSDLKPHKCTIENCTEAFISKKLLAKHEIRHSEPPEEEKKEEKEETSIEVAEEAEKEEVKIEEKPKAKIDVYDLPALNLSESDSSDSEDEKTSFEVKDSEEIEEVKENSILEEDTKVLAENDMDLEVEKSAPIIENIWDDFKNYQANKEKMDSILVDTVKSTDAPSEETEECLVNSALRDHDYCIDPESKPDPSLIEVKPDLTMTQRVDHDYCTANADKKEEVMEVVNNLVPDHVSPKKRTVSSSSDSSNDSDSSSCSCGSNCSCSSSGSSSSSSDSSESDSSTEEGRKRQLARREKRRQRAKTKNGDTNVDVMAVDAQQPLLNTSPDTPILESDLETTESETDEEFYDKQPQILAKKLLKEKREQLLADIGPISNGTFIESTSRPPTPPSYVDEVKPKKKSKSKKKKKRKSERRDYEAKHEHETTSNILTEYFPSSSQDKTVDPITISLKNSPISSQPVQLPQFYHSQINNDSSTPRQISDPNLRASKRKRVPNKFYGYSSDEEQEKGFPMPKWKRTEVQPAPRSPLVVPPITIKTVPPIIQQPPIEPISIRPASQPGEMRIHHRMPPVRFAPPRPAPMPSERDSASDSESSSEETPPKPNQPQLYCYCRCPYDEVSEMIGCDSSDCAIEWFHFECVGIMVPPKGQWFCPDCRKKKQQRREHL